MAEYDKDYMQEHCIDVYFRYGERPFHVLTYGTIIPALLNDVDRNRSLQHQTAVDWEALAIPSVVNINYEYVSAVRRESIQAAGDMARYEQLIPDEDTIVQMFKPNAELGFYSYDCVEELEDGKGRYRLVAYPGMEINVHDFDTLPEFTGIEVAEEDEESGIILQFKM